MASIIDFNILSIIVFIIALALIVYRDRKKFKRESIVLLRRTQRGKDFVIRLGTGAPRFWKVFGNIGIIVGFIASFVIIILLFQTLYVSVQGILEGRPAPPGAGIVLPSASTTPQFLPGFFLVPFWYWIISIALLVVLHEGLHGVFSAREQVRIKSLGVGLLAVIPLAFVEPDEKQLKKKGLMPQMRVFAAGSFINILMAFFVAWALLPAMNSFYTQGGVAVLPITGFPAHEANLSGIIIQINDNPVNNVSQLTEALKGLKPGDTVTLKARVFDSEGNEQVKDFSLKAVRRPEGIAGESSGFIGIQYDPNTQAFLEVRDEFSFFAPAVQFTTGLLVFIFILNLGIGLFNLLPLGPLDGGRMWLALLQRFAPKKANRILKGLTWLSILLVLAVLLIQFVRL